MANESQLLNFIQNFAYCDPPKLFFHWEDAILYLSFTRLSKSHLKGRALSARKISYPAFGVKASIGVTTSLR